MSKLGLDNPDSSQAMAEYEENTDQSKKSSWVCRKCQKHNELKNEICSKCSHRLGEDKRKALAKKEKIKQRMEKQARREQEKRANRNPKKASERQRKADRARGKTQTANQQKKKKKKQKQGKCVVM